MLRSWCKNKIITLRPLLKSFYPCLKNPFLFINQPLDHPLLEEKGIELGSQTNWILVHPLLSGNKFFKLKYNLEKSLFRVAFNSNPKLLEEPIPIISTLQLRQQSRQISLNWNSFEARKVEPLIRP